MGDTQSIAKVSISISGSGLSREGFGIPCIFTPHLRTLNRADVYASLAAMTTAGFEECDPAYVAASRFFEPDDHVSSVVVGRRKVNAAMVSIRNLENETEYTVTINGTDFAFTSDASATRAEIATGLAAAINGGSEPVTAVAVGNYVYLSLDTGSAWTLAVDANLAFSLHVAKITVNTANVGTDTVTINGTACSFVADGYDTVATIAAGLVAEITAQAAAGLPVAAAAVGGESGVFYVFATEGNPTSTPVVQAVSGFTYAVTADMTGVYSLTETPAAMVEAVKAERDTWYAAMLTSRVQAEQEALASKIETMKKLYLTAASDANIIDVAPATDETSLPAVLKGLNYLRTGTMYHSDATGGTGDSSPESALSGAKLTVDLDEESDTWEYPTLTGVDTDTLTDTQFANAVGDQFAGTGGKNVIVYLERGGAGRVMNTKVASGEWIDTIVGCDWLETRLSEDVFIALASGKKVPFTNAGIMIIVNTIIARLKKAIQTGFLAFDETLDPTLGFRITYPDVSETEATDREARVLKGISFHARIAGAIHLTDIVGTLAA